MQSQEQTRESNSTVRKKPNTEVHSIKKKRKNQSQGLTNDYLEFSVGAKDKNIQKRYMVKENKPSSKLIPQVSNSNLGFDNQQSLKKVQLKIKERKNDQQDSKFLVKISPQNSLFSQVKDNPINAFNLKKILDQVQITKTPQKPKRSKQTKKSRQEFHSNFLRGSADSVLPVISPKVQMTKTFIKTDQSKKELGLTGPGMPVMPNIGIGTLQPPNIELRGQYKNQLKGSFVKRGGYQPRKTQIMVGPGQVKSSMGTFSQARRDLSPSVDNGLVTVLPNDCYRTSFNFNLGESENILPRRNVRNKRLLESLDSGLVKIAERTDNDSWGWQIEEKYEYTSKSSRERADLFGSQAPESRRLPPLSTQQSPGRQNQMATKINNQTQNQSMMNVEEQFQLVIERNEDNWNGKFEQQPNIIDNIHLRGSQQQTSRRSSLENPLGSNDKISESMLQADDQIQDDAQDKDQAKKPQQLKKGDMEEEYVDDEEHNQEDVITKQEQQASNLKPLIDKKALEPTNKITNTEMTVDDSKDDIQIVQEDQLTGELPETEDCKEIGNSYEKIVNLEPKSLFIDGYRASTQTTAPQWATSRRGHIGHTKQAKVLPQLSKPSFKGPPDVTFVTRSRKEARPRPASLLVVLFEGVLAINDREQNIADAGADFYDDTEEEETDDDSDENEEDPGDYHGIGGRDQMQYEGSDQKGQEGGPRDAAKTRTRKDGNGASLSLQQSAKSGIYKSQQNGLETIREESPRVPSRAEKSNKKTAHSRKAKKKRKRALQKQETVVFEESSAIMPPWLSRDDKGVPKPQLPGHCLYFRHGLARGLSKLKQEFFIVILLQRKNSTRRRKQIIRALEEQDLHFDAIYQHNSLFCGDSRGNSMGGSRFFSIDWIVQDTGYTPARTVFLTSVDQSQYNYDINEYLEKDMLPPKFEPKPHDFGLLPLPYTVSGLEDEEGAGVADSTGFRLDIHKLVVIGVPHVLQNNDQPSMNKSKAISFKQICCMIKNFNQLCLSFENTPSPEARSDSECPDEELSLSGSQQSEGSEESSLSWSQPKYFVKEKYRRIFEPQRQANPKEAEIKAADEAANPKKTKAQSSKEQNDQQLQLTQLEDTAQEKGVEAKSNQQRGSDGSSFDDEESSETDSSQLLIKEPKVFYKGFKKAREHSMFSLIYQSFPLLAQKALSERFITCLLKYRSKLTKIDGLACRLIRLKERQAMEDKENSMASPYQQHSSAKDTVQRYEALRRQPGLQASMQHLRTYYKEIYDECVLPHSKVTGQTSAKEGGQSLHVASQIQSQLGPAASNPTLEQLRRLRACYAHEVAAMEKLISDSATDFQKSFNIMSLSGQLYTAKRMTNYGASSEFQFKAKLIVAGQQQQQQQAMQRREAKELIADPEEDEQVQGDQETSLEQRRGSAPNLNSCGIFSSIDGKRITNLRNQIPVEQVRNVVDWLSKKAPSHQVQYQIMQPN